MGTGRARHPAALPRAPRSSARSSPRRSGRACSAWRASRSARSASSTSRSSTRCAGRSSSAARWTASSSRRWRRSTPRQLVRRGEAQARPLGEGPRLRRQGRAQGAAEILWFVGDYASFDPRNQRISQALARVLRQAGVDFGILYDGERTAGNDVRRAGEEGLWSSLAEENVETISSCRFDRILTSDPHTFNTLKNEYPQLGGAGRSSTTPSSCSSCSRPAACARARVSATASPTTTRARSGATTASTTSRARCSPRSAASSSRCRGTGTTPSAAAPAAGASG